MNRSTRTLVFVVAGVAVYSGAALAQAPPTDMVVLTARHHHLNSLGEATRAVHQPPGLVKDGEPKIPGGGAGARPGGGGNWTDPVLQATYPSPFAATLLTSGEGIGANGSSPPDANLAVGDTQVVEIVNTQFAVYDKAGTLLAGPVPIHTLFTGLGGMCETSDGGDPIVLFDQIAHRWFVSQLEYNSSFTQNLLCTAVSTSVDATGGYTLYEWNFGSNLPDYPKVGVWPDAYYFSANIFWGAAFFIGAEACAFDRVSMINGLPANGVCFSTGNPSLLPASLDGATLPDPGEPGFYVQAVANNLRIWKFHVNFTNINLSTFTSVNRAVGAVHTPCPDCVPQPGTTMKLDTLGDRLMYRLAYRRFPTYESLTVNQAVQVRSTSAQTGVRWYEIRNPNGAATIAQQSTFAPDASVYRWMGSMAQDKQGNMLIGYSAASASLYPSIGYAGRLATDPVNQLSSEFVSFFGTGAQTTLSRWGDYAGMAIDPVDDCTFWFVGEYLLTSGNQWHTRLESLRFPSCGP